MKKEYAVEDRAISDNMSLITIYDPTGSGCIHIRSSSCLHRVAVVVTEYIKSVIVDIYDTFKVAYDEDASNYILWFVTQSNANDKKVTGILTRSSFEDSMLESSVSINSILKNAVDNYDDNKPVSWVQLNLKLPNTISDYLVKHINPIIVKSFNELPNVVYVDSEISAHFSDMSVESSYENQNKLAQGEKVCNEGN